MIIVLDTTSEYDKGLDKTYAVTRLKLIIMACKLVNDGIYARGPGKPTRPYQKIAIIFTNDSLGTVDNEWDPFNFIFYISTSMTE